MVKRKTSNDGRKTALPKHTRYRLMFKFWKDGEEKPLTESTFTTDFLQSARAEFRRQLRMLIYPNEIDRETMKTIVASGYVVAAGPFLMGDADRFAMLLTDTLKPVENPPMYAFERCRDGWSMRCFMPEG